MLPVLLLSAHTLTLSLPPSLPLSPSLSHLSLGALLALLFPANAVAPHRNLPHLRLQDRQCSSAYVLAALLAPHKHVYTDSDTQTQAQAVRLAYTDTSTAAA